MSAKTIVILLVVGCGALLVAAIASCAGFFIFTLQNVDASVTPEIDKLFAAIERESLDEIYDASTSSDFQKTTTRQQFQELGLTIRTRLGALKSKSLVQFHVRQANANSHADVAYNATFENGTGTIKAIFVKQGDRWLLEGFQVNSPEFQKDLATGKCPHCGEPHSSNAKFCPSCGKPLSP